MENGRSDPDHCVVVERRDHVLVMTLDRPEVRNAVDQATSDAMAAALDEFDADRDLRVGIVTGAGGCFSAGMDLKALSATGRRPSAGDRGFGGMLRRASDKPLIAAVEGFALGGGLEMALACDLIVAARDARLGIPEVKRSLIAAGGGLRRLPRRLPVAVAAEMAFTGEPIDAQRAYDLGLVNRLAAPGGALAAALELAAAIAQNGPLAIVASKAVLERQWSWSDDEFFERQAEIYAPVAGSRDAREGVQAFVERRPPRWEGR